MNWKWKCGALFLSSANRAISVLAFAVSLLSHNTPTPFYVHTHPPELVTAGVSSVFFSLYLTPFFCVRTPTL